MTTTLMGFVDRTSRRASAPQFYLQDAGSSTGTFLRQSGSIDDVASRLSEAGQTSDLFELKDGDVVILGAYTQLDGGMRAPRPRPRRPVAGVLTRPT